MDKNIIQRIDAEVEDLIMSLTARGNTYYVATTGNDANTGLSWDEALLTIDAAVNKCSSNAGDAIKIAAGNYDESVNTSGVIVDVEGLTIIGENVSEDIAVLTVVNSNVGATAVFTVTADNVTIKNVTITEDTTTVEGIVSSGDYCLFENIQLNGAMENGIHLSGASHDRIRDCKFIGMTNDGIELSGASTYNIIDGGSISSAIDNGIHLNGAGADNNIIRNLQIFGISITTNGIHINGADSNMITQTVEINECAVGVLLSAGSNNNTINASITCILTDVDNSGTATNSFYGSMTQLHDDVRHIDKFMGAIWYVDKTNGADTNDGETPRTALATIAAGIAASGSGDRIIVRGATGKYDEAGLDLNLQGLELFFEEGAILEDTGGGTVLSVSAQDCKLSGVFIDNDNNGGIGFDVTTAASICMTNCTAMQCTTGFMLDGVKGTFSDCAAIDNTVTGFDIQTLHAIFKDCIANGNGDAVRGFYLSDSSADMNTFINCHSVSNTLAGWEIVAGADNNTFAGCSTGGNDGSKVDAGTNNTWPRFDMNSQIVAGQSIQEDLEAIYNVRTAGRRQVLEVSVTAAANAGDVTLATVTTQPCLIEAIVISANTAAQTDLTSAAVTGGAAKVVSFLDAAAAAKANIDAVDEQVSWTGAVRLGATKTIIMSLVGTGATAVDLTVTITYYATEDGGYLV